MALMGERVRLRAVDPADAETMVRWVNDPEVTEHLSLRYPMSLAAERQWAEGAAGRNQYSAVTFAIERIEDGQVIGNCGLYGAVPEDRGAELGVMIGEKAQWGQGHGFDALCTLLAFGFREMNLRRIWLRVDADHPRGRALYERLGFTQEGHQREEHWRAGRPRDLAVMSILRAEFDARYGAAEEVGDVPRG